MQSTRSTFLKVFGRREAFELEWRVYRRLRSAGVLAVSGFAVPSLLDADPTLGVLELSRVQPPFVLDFASVTIDQTPEQRWPDEPGRLQASWARAEEAFSAHPPAHWARVVALYEEFGRRFGVWMLDLHPGNIAFADADRSVPCPTPPRKSMGVR